MTPFIHFLLRRLVATVCGATALAFAGCATAQPTTPAPVARPASAFPAAFQAALAKAQIPLESVALWTAPVDGTPPRAAYRDDVLVSPASTMKLVTTYAALDRLGPAYTWQTRVYADGEIDGGALRGNLYIQGGGDPRLVMERLWGLLRQVQQRGIKVVMGDIVIDRTTYRLPPHNPAAFDDEPLRPYNAAPDALLVNFKSVVLRFVPDPAAGVARIQVAPPVAQLDIPPSVPLEQGSRCPATWRTGMGLDVGTAGQWRFSGRYPAACGERNWAIAYPQPEQFARLAVEGMWREMGGSLTGQVVDGITPATLQPLLTERSATLAEIIRDVNKYSNNVMADHVFLAMCSVGNQGQPVSFEGAQAAAQLWWERRIGNPPGSLLMDNGSGLSRDARVTAQGLGRMLMHAWQSPVMPELLASMPAVGVDGTMRRSRASAAGHIKTGSLRDVNAIAGYVLGRSGQRHVVVAIINHPNAAAARGEAFDALIDWVADDLPQVPVANAQR
ncbi:hypothetical protein AAV94_09665 [Lampropedia cohaerens]|uniref:Peptidase M15 n=1 Tax=Lampropedia cohaerens TaxID=1610491 RepID=A0A0U1PYJ3_9BURK|nr:D-alanyl-D-alanine carboxypeptidase/D-alanyl-D-alanine-endopeptidase [Lampropedia cohaerens]KKW67589.1 hypothetical protein AAV94_09665 [Lampropedia cohaerens]